LAAASDNAEGRYRGRLRGQPRLLFFTVGFSRQLIVVKSQKPLLDRFYLDRQIECAFWGFGMRSLILGLLLLTADVAHADQTGIFTIGIGNLSCGKFIASIGKRPPGKMETTRDGDLVSENAMYTQWLMGFVSGVNSVLYVYNATHPGEEQQQQIMNIDPAGVDL